MYGRAGRGPNGTWGKPAGGKDGNLRLSLEYWTTPGLSSADCRNPESALSSLDWRGVR